MKLLEISKKLNGFLVQFSFLSSLYDLQEYLGRINSLILVMNTLKDKKEIEVKLSEIERAIDELQSKIESLAPEKVEQEIVNRVITMGNFEPPKMKEIKKRKVSAEDETTSIEVVEPIVEAIKMGEGESVVQQTVIEEKKEEKSTFFGAFDFSLFDEPKKIETKEVEEVKVEVEKKSKSDKKKPEPKKEDSVKEDSIKKVTKKTISTKPKSSKRTKVELVVAVEIPKSLIDLDRPVIRDNIDVLLKDRTSGKNIFWATDSYLSYGKRYEATDSITEKTLYDLDKSVLQPRVLKSLTAQKDRTKSKAEVFTPTWICNKMNNLLDVEWFGYQNVFNVEDEESKTWTVNKGNIKFKNGKTFDDYINSTRLEITCGEAPFLVSRYDATTGVEIEVGHRIGLLDRKLRVIDENIEDRSKYLTYVKQAYKSIYGYEYQGDNLLIARINLLLTFEDYYKAKFGEEPTEESREIAEIISWNLWQMDGLSYKLPLEGEKYCKIKDWDANKTIEFRSMKTGV